MTSNDIDVFLKYLAKNGNVSEAARHAQITRSKLYKLKASEPKFAEAWTLALEEAADRLASEAMRRAIEGFEEVKYFKGEPVGTVRKYSDQLLMFLLKAYKPNLYGQKSGQEQNMENTTHRHARSSLLKKMETLTKEDDGDTTTKTDQ